MDQRGDEVHTSSTEATGASQEGVVRWVLIIGLFLAVVLLTLIWITGAFSQDEGDRHENVSREISGQKAEAQQGQGEPTTPAFDDSTATPTASATPGDAPAGDPKPDAQ